MPAWSTLVKVGTTADRRREPFRASRDHKGVADLASNASAGGKTVFSKGYGLASYEQQVPMQHNYSYPIGSNTKLFTSVAIWQLYKQGKLSVFDPVSKYLDPKDLGLDGSWCPRLVNTTSGPCEDVQIQHLLRMSSGLFDSDNCAYAPGSWQLAYCLTAPGPSELKFSSSDMMTLQIGGFNIAGVLKLLGFLKQPLEFRPGTGYSYVNANFMIAGYIVEKLSGMPIQAYFQKHIFDPLGMKETNYDVTNGQNGIYRNSVPYPSYIPYLSPLSVTMDPANQDYLGPLVFTSGNVPDKASPEGPPYARVVKVGRNWGSTGGLGPGFQSFGNAAGAIWSTTADMNKWFRAYTTQPEALGLSSDVVKQMQSLCTPLWSRNVNQSAYGVDIQFCQGVVANKKASGRLGVTNLYYMGSSGGFEAVVYVEVHPTDPSKDVFVNVASTTVLDVAPLKEYLGKDGQGRCIWVGPVGAGSNGSTMTNSSSGNGSSSGGGDRSVPQVLCDATSKVLLLEGLSNYLAATAVRLFSGQPWFQQKSF